MTAKRRRQREGRKPTDNRLVSNRPTDNRPAAEFTADVRREISSDESENQGAIKVAEKNRHKSAPYS